MDYPIDSDAMREFYPGTYVWKQELFVRILGYSYLGRARAVKDGILIFIPGVSLEDIK